MVRSADIIGDFVPNSDGTGAAWEGFLLVREPNRCIPGLKGKKNKAPESRDKSGRASEVTTSRGPKAS